MRRPGDKMPIVMMPMTSDLAVGGKDDLALDPAHPQRPSTEPPFREPAGSSGRLRPSRTRRRTVVLVALVTTFVLGWFIKTRLLPSQAVTPITASVTIGDVEQTVLASGTLKPVKLVAVGAQVSGRLTSLKVALGQKIKKGELVAEMDSSTQQNSLRTAEASLQDTRAQRQEKEATLAFNEASLARQKTTLALTASSRADYDSAEANVKTTRAQIAQLDAKIIEGEVDIETARINLGYTRITAPIDGTVLAIVTQEGQTVNAVQSAPTIVVIGQLETMTIRAEISEADVVKVKPGQNVYFTILGEPDNPYHAILQSIEPAPESIKSDSSFNSSTTSSTSSSSSSSASTAIYYNGIFNVPNADNRLRTYMTAVVHIVLGEARNVLTVPAAALKGPAADGTYTVQVIDTDGKAATRTIGIGLNNKITAEVRDGLKEGERVVIGQRNATPTQTPPSGGMP
jgi:macrolide-specific efflux system membrane fusion protein